MSKIHDMKEIVDVIDTPGCHILLCLCAGTFGVVLGLFSTWLVWPDEKLALMFAGMTGAMTGFFQIAAYAMRGQEKANGKGKTPIEPPKPE